MKGIILAGGAGTRLYPGTSVICKQLLTVYDKPMIYYPLSTLMLAGIKEVLIISTPQDTPKIKDVLGNGRELGMSFTYEVQEKPRGIAHALIIGADFIGWGPVCLILGDNLFYGHRLSSILQKAACLRKGAMVFGYWVKDPERYGVVEFNSSAQAVAVEEKPQNPRSNYAIPGIYFYDHRVVEITREIKPSGRGELEITDVNREYLKRKELTVQLLGRGIAWLDTGTPDSLMEASNFIATVEKRQGLKISCIEEVAYRMGFIKESQLLKLVEAMPSCDYREYLRLLLNHKKLFKQV